MDQLPWHRPAIGGDEIAEVVDCLRSGWLTTGPKVAQFEDKVRTSVGAEAAFATTSCTAALHLAMLAAGLGPGDEVITTGMTFCATVNVIEHIGAVPVLVDVEPDTLNMAPADIASAITPRTRAVVAVHYGGHPVDMDAVLAVARRHDLLVIEDAAHAIGARYRGRPVGGLGDLAAFSFYANKNMTTGEGGMLVGRADLVQRARLLGRHGIDRPVWDRHGSRGPGRYDVVLPGLKYNMSDIHAAIGLHQFDRLAGFIARRAELASRYDHELSSLHGLLLPRARPDVNHAWHLYPLRVTDECGISRDELARVLAEEGIGTSVHFRPIPWFTTYRDIRRGPIPVTEQAGDQLLSLPCFPGMTDADVERVAATIRKVLS